MKPLLRPHYIFRTEAPDSSGEEVIVFSSESRRLVLKGHNFRSFVSRVVPLLDGTRTLSQIHSEVADQIALVDLEAALQLLEAQRIIEDAEACSFDPGAVRHALPQISYLRESHSDPVQAMDALASATVTVVGLGAIGSAAALSLVASRVGRIRLVDSQLVMPGDPFLSQHYCATDVGALRVEAVRDRATGLNPDCKVEIFSGQVESDSDLDPHVADAQFVVGAADVGMLSLSYKLNRVCFAHGVPWSYARSTGFEGVVGPTVVPGRTGCFLCADMRSVACRHNPEDALRHLRFLDRRKQDDSTVREGLAFESGIVGRLLAREAFRYLVSADVALAGRLLIFDFEEMTSAQHRVLRVPNCPVCGAPDDKGAR